MPNVTVHHKRPVPVHGYVRVFSPEIHGNDYKETAKMYAKTNADNVISIEGIEEEEAKEIKGKTKKDKVK